MKVRRKAPTKYRLAYRPKDQFGTDYEIFLQGYMECEELEDGGAVRLVGDWETIQSVMLPYRGPDEI